MRVASASAWIRISIPAPARGATGIEKGAEFEISISIPAPARGATGQIVPSCRAVHISIPAPARGATWAIELEPLVQNYFNSRPCARGDVRHHGRGHVFANFNSRPCARGDVVGTLTLNPAFISIPAPARGATCPATWTARRRPYFNSRPCARGDWP